MTDIAIKQNDITAAQKHAELMKEALNVIMKLSDSQLKELIERVEHVGKKAV